MVISFTVVTIKNRRRGESKPGFIWRSTAKVCVKIRPIRRFRELCNNTIILYILPDQTHCNFLLSYFSLMRAAAYRIKNCKGLLQDKIERKYTAIRPHGHFRPVFYLINSQYHSFNFYILFDNLDV